MALVKCGECGKQVSDKANTCPACGNPIGGGGSVASSAFEKRIEQYKAKGYNLVRRDADTVTMAKLKSNSAILMTVGFIFASLMFFWGIGSISNPYFFEDVFGLEVSAATGFVNLMVGIGLCAAITFSVKKSSQVIISLTKAGKIEEIGNILNKK